MTLNKINEDLILNQLNWRYAVKKFDSSKKINEENWNLIEDCLTLSASSFGLQPWKFLVVENKSTRAELRKFSWNQPQVEDASHYVVFCARKDINQNYVDTFIKKVAEDRQLKTVDLEGYKNMILGFASSMNQEQVLNWNAKQVYISLGNIMTVCSLLKIDTCPLEGIDKDKYDEILNLKGSDYTSCFSCAFGFRDKEDSYSTLKKTRFNKKDIIVKI